jgi:hypothetical protein
MIYLVRTDKWIKECSSWSQVKKHLMVACVEWITDKNYISDKRYNTVESLFDLGMNEQDFGDVAQVFRITCKDENENFFFDCCSPQDIFNMERIL